MCSFVFSAVLFYSFKNYSVNQEDIYYCFIEGKRLLSLENPYARILFSDMRHNDKYATYLPGFYLLSALVQWIGFDHFEDWIKVFRIVFFIFYFLIGLVIFFTLESQISSFLIACFGLFFWLFNLWTIYVGYVAHIDFIPLFFLILSVAYLDKKPFLACFLLGISLIIKQMALLVLPLFLIYFYQYQKKKIKEIFLLLLAIAIIPFFISLPFLLWDAKAFFLSLFFSVTRVANNHFQIYPLEYWLGIEGIVAKIPFLLLTFLIYFIFYQKKINYYFAIFLIFLTFIFFNSVIFRQYFIWPVAFLPFLFLTKNEKID